MSTEGNRIGAAKVSSRRFRGSSKTEEAGADETYEDFVDRSYILINEASPSEKDFVDTFKVGSDQYPTRSALERICLFGCGECDKPFTRMANLVRHWGLHRRPSIPDISARSEETIDLSRSAEFRGLAVAPAEAPQVPSLRKSRAVTTRVSQALEQIAGPLPVQELLPARTRHIRYTITALMGLFAVTLLLTMIQLNIESYREHKQKLAHANKALATGSVQRRLPDFFEGMRRSKGARQ
ncbi:hypothetical protein A4X06_0g2090 [Tilletia controversa]|uniref:C2H2-type domain-containing protein n=2 Tax=Tilletia TaxID=13289 RepID=A0A8X7SZH4_9BASI|nr:hypothetical protein CF335_g5003 [Tilletia laevis]KAE8252581.1 hypothetical protein A4X06_0g2090 [Tilletia controversa]CAD6952512.1 unnamed protein product [Tilletia caries]